MTGAAAGRFLGQAADLLDRGFPVEEDGRGLNGGDRWLVP